MCQISIVNTHDAELNKKLWLILGTIGSPQHPHGWGTANAEGKYFKCEYPLFYTEDAGSIIAKLHGNNTSPLLGHIRNASPRVPVTQENAHPFYGEGIAFVHNGKLTPKVEKDFVMELDVPDIDDKTHVQKADKDGKPVTKKVARSDSLIFFEAFLQEWTANPEKLLETEESRFARVFKTTMDKFYGKFAMVFVINGHFYIIRGKTADLHIMYLLESSKGDSKSIGWAINTNKDVLDAAGVLVSNLRELDGKTSLHFTIPKILKPETIYVADNFDIKEIGDATENPFPVTTHYTSYPNSGRGWQGGDSNFQSGGNTTNKSSESSIAKLTQKVFAFMDMYSLTAEDIFNLLYARYGVSSLEINEKILRHFVTRVLAKLSNKTDKKRRKRMKGIVKDYLRSWNYNSTEQYPWMLNTKGDQDKLLARLEKK